MKKILATLCALGAATVLAACTTAGAQAGPPTSTSAEPTTTTPPATTSTTTPVTTTPPATTTTTPPATTTSRTTTKPKTTTTTTQAKPAAGVPCAATASACVDLSAHQAWLLKDGQIVYGPVPMLPGTKSNPTPTGTFKVSSKVKNYHSKQFDAPMPNSVFFYPGIAFHTGSLTQYSHGCIHLSSAASSKFFGTLKVGDVVQVVK